MTFNSFNLDPVLLANINTLGYTQPTPIQTQSIPAILAGKDVMGLAQTGTGKTAAFALPILQRLRERRRSGARALIIAPTRELAQQIFEAIEQYSKNTTLRSMTMYGGVNINPQIEKLKGGVDIIVGCPGRILDHLKQGTLNLAKLEVLVLDEADHMFDMGFLPDIRRILRHLPQNRQTLLFSATMPEEIHKLAHEALRDPIKIQVGHTAPAATVKQLLLPVSQHLKADLLIHVLHQIDKESVLVFTRTKHTAKKIALRLEKLGFRATSLQGNLSQNRRQSAMNGFRDGSLQILVATDIVSRGIDVTTVSHVINYDMPSTVEAYIHRIGRTGRAAKEGEAFTFIVDDDKAQVRAIERTLGKQIEQFKFADFNYQATPPARKLMDVATQKPFQSRNRRPKKTKRDERK